MSKKKTLTYEMIRAFTETFDGQDSDAYILEILNGEIDIKKMKSFILDNFVKEGHFKKDKCLEIYKSMTSLKKQKKCEDLVSSEWKDRQQDLTKPEFEGLCFDYVEANTFTDQKEGYWRWQFSWGGPSDELRAFVNRDDSIHRLEYWYLDWFDGAKVNVAAEHDAWSQMQEMINSTAPGMVANG